jgi:hypothetical protein
VFVHSGRKVTHTPQRSRSVVAFWHILVLWLEVFGGSPKYASARGISAGDAFHNTGMRTSDGLDGCNPIGLVSREINTRMMNEIYLELSESFASRSPFAENMSRECFMLPIVKCG